MTRNTGQSEHHNTSHHTGMVFGLVTVVLTLVGWSVTPLFIKHFSHQIDPWTSNGWRYGFAALIWLPYLLYGAKRGKLPPKLMLAAFVPGAINSISQVAFTWAHYKIDPGLLTFGLRAQMVVVAFGAAILFPIERMVIKKPAFLVGLVLVVLGTAGTILFDGDFGAESNTLGVLLALGAGAGFACYALAVRYFMVGMSPIYSFAAISQYTAGSMVVLMLVFGDHSGLFALALPDIQFMWLLISAIIGIAAGHVLYYISIARLGVAVSTGVIQLQPFCVAILSYIWFGEVLETSQWIAGGMAVAGAVTMLVVQHITTSRLKKRAGDESMELPADHVAAAAEGEAEEPHSGQVSESSPSSE